MKIKKAVKRLGKTLTQNNDLRESYIENIATAFQNACRDWRIANPTRKSALPSGIIHVISNDVATHFVDNFTFEYKKAASSCPVKPPKEKMKWKYIAK